MDSGAGLAPKLYRRRNFFDALGQQLQGERSFDCIDDVQMFTALTSSVIIVAIYMQQCR